MEIAMLKNKKNKESLIACVAELLRVSELIKRACAHVACRSSMVWVEIENHLLGSKFKWVFDVSCGIHASKSWVMGAPIR